METTAARRRLAHGLDRVSRSIYKPMKDPAVKARWDATWSRHWAQFQRMFEVRETSTCVHCGQPISRDGMGWGHERGGDIRAAFCFQPPTATPAP